MKQAISRWPAVYVRVPPELFARIEAESDSRTLPASVIVREALARAFGQDRGLHGLKIAPGAALVALGAS